MIGVVVNDLVSSVRRLEAMHKHSLGEGQKTGNRRMIGSHASGKRSALDNDIDFTGNGQNQAASHATPSSLIDATNGLQQTKSAHGAQNVGTPTAKST